MNMVLITAITSRIIVWKRPHRTPRTSYRSWIWTRQRFRRDRLTSNWESKTGGRWKIWLLPLKMEENSTASRNRSGTNRLWTTARKPYRNEPLVTPIAGRIPRRTTRTSFACNSNLPGGSKSTRSLVVPKEIRFHSRGESRPWSAPVLLEVILRTSSTCEWHRDVRSEVWQFESIEQNKM